MARRRFRSRVAKPSASIDMTSLIDLTFLLLVTFMITLPALEQAVQIILPKAKADALPKKDNKANTITIDEKGQHYFNGKKIAFDDLEKKLAEMAKADPDLPVLIRGDERQSYGTVMEVVKMVYKLKIHRMALVTMDE